MKQNKKKVSGKLSLAAFHTRKAANEGVWLNISLPTGEETEMKLHVLGVDSDVFREAVKEAAEKRLEVAGNDELDEAAKEERYQAIHKNLQATLVDDWNFEETCTRENVIAFFESCPQIGDIVDQIAMKRAAFFEKRSSASSDTPNSDSAST